MRDFKVGNWWGLAILCVSGCNSSPVIQSQPTASRKIDTSTAPLSALTVAPPFTIPDSTFLPFPSPTPKFPETFVTGGSCSLHGDLLQRDLVRIQYGLPQTNVKNYFEDRDAALPWIFPNSNENISGGCLVKADSPVFKDVLFCPQCRLAEDEWVKQHPPFNPPRP